MSLSSWFRKFYPALLSSLYVLVDQRSADPWLYAKAVIAALMLSAGAQVIREVKERKKTDKDVN